MGNPTETGPKNIGFQTRAIINARLAQNQSIGELYGAEGLIGRPSEEFWSDEVLRQTRAGHKISYLKVVEENRLALMQPDQIVLSEISSKRLRLVDWENSFSAFNGNLALVYPSGYVLDPISRHFIWWLNDGRTRRRDITFLELEEHLTTADQGKKPGIITEETFVKVSPRLAGKRVALMMFETSEEPYVQSPNIRDAVVIDPETMQLIPRKVLRPLAQIKWSRKTSFT